MNYFQLFPINLQDHHIYSNMSCAAAKRMVVKAVTAHARAQAYHALYLARTAMGLAATTKENAMMTQFKMNNPLETYFIHYIIQ